MLSGDKILSYLKMAFSLYVGFCIAVYGFFKVINVQFGSSQKLVTKSLTEMSGMELTWYYFGYSKNYLIIIGIFQMLGSILLILNRTRIFGALILLPIMLNIVFIDYFYQVNRGAFANAIFYTLVILFILYLEKDKLIEILKISFVRSKSNSDDSKLKKIALCSLLLGFAIGLNSLTYYILNLLLN